MNTSLPHNRSAFFETAHYEKTVIDFFRKELENDGQDITSLLFVQKAESFANIVAKQKGVLAGQSDIDMFLQSTSSCFDFTIQWHKKDGETINIGDVICTFSGNNHEILRFERVSLNVLSRLSGIATATYNIQKKSNTQIAGTRKTQWSYLDKKAIFIGGGLTHRIGLFDAVLIKENHFISGKKSDVLTKLFHIEKNVSAEILKNIQFIEIEVENKEEFYEVFTVFLDEKFDINKKYQYVIMLDNFIPETITELFIELEHNNYSKKIRNNKNIFIEISGGITENNIEEYSDLGADVISLGALTHSVMPVDFSLRF